MDADPQEAPDPAVNLEAELESPITANDDQWHEVLTIEVPKLEATYGCRMGIADLSTKNADTRLTLHRQGFEDILTQTIVGDSTGEESFDTGDERELSGGERLVLEFRLGHQGEAEIRAASLFIESTEAW